MKVIRLPLLSGEVIIVRGDRFGNECCVFLVCIVDKSVAKKMFMTILSCETFRMSFPMICLDFPMLGKSNSVLILILLLHLL